MSRGYRFEVTKTKAGVHMAIKAPNNEIVMSGEVQTNAVDAFETIDNMVGELSRNGVRYTGKSLKPEAAC